MAKLDVRDAYRLIPVHPHDRRLLGFRWNDVTYVDLRLPFGLRNSPPLFEMLAEQCEWILREKLGLRSFVRYVDDFLFVSSSADVCRTMITRACELFADLGVPVNADKLKAEGLPAQTQVFLGIELDSAKLIARIDKVRLKEISRLVAEWRARAECSKRELQSLLGKLMFASKVVVSARTFVQRLINALKQFPVGPASESVRMPINECIKSDLLWWEAFLDKWNGVALLLEVAPTVGLLASDASLLGFGGVCGPHWFAAAWPSEVITASKRANRESLPFLELYALVAAVLSFGPSLARKRIPVQLKLLSDSKSAVDALLAGYSRDVGMLALIRELHFASATFSFKLHPAHIQGTSNSLADALSRGQIQKFRELAPSADAAPTPIILPTLAL